MRKTVLTALLGVILCLGFALAGCGDSEDAEKELVEEEVTEESVGMENPWRETDDINVALQGSGLDGFEIAKMEISLGEVLPEGYRYTKGMIETQFPIAAVDMTIRKGDDTVAEVDDGDISGDYNEYKHEWTVEVDGTPVKCFGNREGESTKTIWSKDAANFAILAYGAGGDTDYGLPQKDVETMVRGIK